MAFTLPTYRAPDFAALGLLSAPDVKTLSAPRDGVAPEGYHATTMYPEYYRLNGKWTLAADSRMDCVAVVRGEAVGIVEFRNLRAGDPVVIGRSEDGGEGIFLWTEGFSASLTPTPGMPSPPWCGVDMSTASWRATPWPPTTWRRGTWAPPWARTSTPSAPPPRA